MFGIKNTSARLCAKKAGGAYARGGAYLRDTMVCVCLFSVFMGHKESLGIRLCTSMAYLHFLHLFMPMYVLFMNVKNKQK